jgi:hypothetical protein
MNQFDACKEFGDRSATMAENPSKSLDLQIKLIMDMHARPMSVATVILNANGGTKAPHSANSCSTRH